MDPRTHTLGSTRINYYLKGDNPQLIIHSGTHGNEFQAISSTKKAVKKYWQDLPDLVFIPKVSPSAVAQKTRFNKDGVDINRNFKEDSGIAEAQAVMALTQKFPAPVCISFHEDPDQTAFYLYDNGGNLENTPSFKSLTEEISSQGIEFLNGIDDPDDPHLGFEFKDGYRSFSLDEANPAAGSFSDWATHAGVVKRVLVPEIPGLATQAQKDAIVDAIFRHLVVSLGQ